MAGLFITKMNQVYGYFRKIAQRVADLFSQPPPLHEGASDTLKWFRAQFASDVYRNFSQGQDADGVKWAALKYRVGKPLILTGTLMAAAVNAAANADLFGKEVRTTISGPNYWQWHEYGTSRIPARPFMGPRAETVQGLSERMAADIVQNLIKG